MPAAVPLIGALAGAAVANSLTVFAVGSFYFGSGALFSSIAGGIVSTSINQLGSRALSKKPKALNFSESASVAGVLSRSSVETHKLIYGTARVSGPRSFAHTTDSAPDSTGATVTGTNKFLYITVPLAGHQCNAIPEIYLNEELATIDGNDFVTNAPYYKDGKSYLRITKHLGAPGQTADEKFMAEIPSMWTESHRGDNICYLAIRAEWNQDAFPQGFPNIAAVVEGKLVYDPRTTLTAWSNNGVLCARDYLMNECGVATSRFDDANYTIAHANIADEDVELASGGTEKRYTCDGVIDVGVNRRENLNALVASMAGEVIRVGNKIRVKAGAYEIPSGYITESMLAGDISGDFTTQRGELVNEVGGLYVDPLKNFQPTDFPKVKNATYLAQDNGVPYPKDLTLPFTRTASAAQRIGKIIMEKARQGINAQLPLNHSALKFACGDNVGLSLELPGWEQKEFKVRRWNMGNVPVSAITLYLQEESAGSYDWNSGEETVVDDAPNTTLPNPFFVEPPSSLHVTEEKYVTRGGAGVKAKAIMTWEASPDAFLDRYQPEYKLRSDTDYVRLPRTENLFAEVLDIAPGLYDFRVRALTRVAGSEYATYSVEITGLLDRPTEPQNLTISTIGGIALMRYDQPEDLDVRIGGYVVFRHSPDTSSGWAESTSIGNNIPGSDTVANLPLKPGRYFAKTVDSSGLESENYASVTTTQATALTFANVDSVTEDASFSGSKTNCEIDGSTLKMSIAYGLFSTIPLVSAVSSISGYNNGIAPYAEYAFSAGIDLGAVEPVRLTSHILASIFPYDDNIDGRTGLIDEWDSIDNTNDAAGDAQVWVRYTDDDPSGMPTWSDWQRLDSSEFNSRAFQFQLRMYSYDSIYTVAVSELRVYADQVV